MSGQVLVLTKKMDYWDEISVKKAVLKILKNKARIISHSGQTLHTLKDGTILWVPLIIQLTTFIGYHCKSDNVHYSDKAVFARDNNYCQYIHNHKFKDGKLTIAAPYVYRCTEDDRTIDHVLPISKGGKNSFLNTVCACKYCNEVLKKNRTPEEAGLKLISTPMVPKRNVGDMVMRNFIFNPNKASHKEFIKLMHHGTWS